ncbi:hypothetical protein PENSPDRAFT_97445 [Peniophora sp. CONT]|nr:hypothetical protein PENSPDRAFT_97445 [Peniophora sp. CONT]
MPDSRLPSRVLSCSRCQRMSRGVRRRASRGFNFQRLFFVCNASTTRCALEAPRRSSTSLSSILFTCTNHSRCLGWDFSSLSSSSPRCRLETHLSIPPHLTSGLVRTRFQALSAHYRVAILCSVAYK